MRITVKYAGYRYEAYILGMNGPIPIDQACEAAIGEFFDVPHGTQIFCEPYDDVELAETTPETARGCRYFDFRLVDWQGKTVGTGNLIVHKEAKHG